MYYYNRIISYQICSYHITCAGSLLQSCVTEVCCGLTRLSVSLAEERYDDLIVCDDRDAAMDAQLPAEGDLLPTYLKDRCGELARDALHTHLLHTPGWSKT